MEEIQRMAFEMEMAGFMNKQWLPLIHTLTIDEMRAYYNKFKNLKN